MRDLLGCLGPRQTRCEVVSDAKPATASEIETEALLELALPASAQDRVLVAELSELQLDQAVEDGATVLRRGDMASAASDGDCGNEAHRDEHSRSHPVAHRKKWTRMGGESAATG